MPRALHERGERLEEELIGERKEADLSKAGVEEHHAMMAEHFPKPAVPPRALLADVAIVLGRLGPCRREGQNAYFAGQFLVEQIPVQPDHDLHVFADRVDLRTAILDSYA